MRLAPIVLRVVKLPNIVIKRGRLFAREQPWSLVPGYRGPALVVDTAIAEHLEVLRLMTLCRLRIVKRVQHADAFDGVLLHAVHKEGLGKARCFKDCRCNVDDVVELPPHLTLRVAALRPMNNGSIPCSAPVRSYLFGPLVWCVHCVRPAHRIVVVGIGATEFVEPGGRETPASRSLPFR